MPKDQALPAQSRESVARQPFIVFVFCSVAVAALNATLLFMPPVWDAAAGVFAPAIHLAETGFDLRGLLSSPGYLQAGPNVHSLSLVTFVTFAAISITGGEPQLYLPALHTLQFLLAGLAGALTFDLTRRCARDPWIAGLVTATLLLFPLFLVQTGALYTEVAGCALVLLAVWFFARRRHRALAACVAGACLVKSFGVVPVVGLGALVVLEPGATKSERASRAAALFVPAFIIEASRWAIAAPASLGEQPLLQHLELHLEKVLVHLLAVPDLLALVSIGVVAAALTTLRGEWPQLLAGGPADRTRAAALVLPLALVGFIAAVPLSGAAFPPLARYYVWVLPLLLITAALQLLRLSSLRIATVALAGFLVFVALNRDGGFYPVDDGPLRHFSESERSYEYLDFYRVQRDGVRGIADKNRGLPVFVTRGEYYYLSSPLMGWVDEPVRDVRFVLEPPFDSGRLEDYPPDFFVLASDGNPYHGRRVALEVIHQALERTDHAVVPAGRWQHGRYTAELVQIRSLAKRRTTR